MNTKPSSTKRNHFSKIEKYLDTYTADLCYQDPSGTRYYATSIEGDDDNFFYGLYAIVPGKAFKSDRQYFHTAEGLAVHMKTISNDLRKWHVVKY